MGSISSKLAAKQSDRSTPLKTMPPKVIVDCDVDREIETNLLDPRSPHICRTPLNEAINTRFPITKNLDLTEIERTPSKPRTAADNPSCLLQSKLIRELNYNLIDPRSPSQFIDRTPIAFGEDDRPVYVDFDRTANSIEETEQQPETSKVEIPIVSERDPRSPSDGVERTPIIFADEISDQTAAIVESVTMEKLVASGIENKPLERVKNRAPRSRLAKKAPSQSIYEDKKEDFVATPSPSKQRAGEGTPKRTPLSCVANKSHLRSKSVENSTKLMKNRLPLSSYDDYSLNTIPKESCGSGESFQLMSPRCLNI